MTRTYTWPLVTWTLIGLGSLIGGTAMAVILVIVKAAIRY